jgi:thioredoxin-dependent peroxiredoxin
MKSLITVILLILSIPVFSEEEGKVKIGDQALNFTLKTVQADKVNLKDLYHENPVVLVVLRGWPGYQCPICTRQVGELVAEVDNFAKYGATVLMVYPGPSEELQEHAIEFSQDFQFPQNYFFAIDPGYSMVNKYGLRWDAPKETAYPSTYVIDKNGKVVFVKVSNSHGGRSTPEEIFGALDKL